MIDNKMKLTEEIKELELTKENKRISKEEIKNRLIEKTAELKGYRLAEKDFENKLFYLLNNIHHNINNIKKNKK